MTLSWHRASAEVAPHQAMGVTLPTPQPPVGLEGTASSHRGLFSSLKISWSLSYGVWTCLRPVTPSFSPIPPFRREGMSVLCLCHYCILGARNCLGSQAPSWRAMCLEMELRSGVTHIRLRPWLDETRCL